MENLGGLMEKELIKRARIGDQGAITFMLAKYENIASPMIRCTLPRQRDDLLQEARLGILKAIIKFDLRRKVKFSTYCYFRIKERIYDYVEKEYKHKNSKLASLWFHNRLESKAWIA